MIKNFFGHLKIVSQLSESIVLFLEELDDLVLEIHTAKVNRFRNLCIKKKPAVTNSRLKKCEKWPD
jgi:hypothetical protein